MSKQINETFSYILFLQFFADWIFKRCLPANERYTSCQYSYIASACHDKFFKNTYWSHRV